MIAIGCDHGALELKEQLIEHLKKRGIECKDYGTYTKDSCDYPVYAKKVAEAILSGECEEGILLCGTGIGMSMAANKIKGIRAALCSDCFSAQATKEHNNANVLCKNTYYLHRLCSKEIHHQNSLLAIRCIPWIISCYPDLLYTHQPVYWDLLTSYLKVLLFP